MASGRTDYQAKLELDQFLGGSAYTPAAPVYIGLLTDTNTQAQRAAGTITEMTGNGYARVSVANTLTQWPAATGASPATKHNANSITFPTPTGAQGTGHAFGIWDAATSGNLLGWGDLLSAAEKLVSVATSGTVTAYAHGYANGTLLKFSSVGGAALPGGLTDGAYYYVISTATNTFSLSLTSGGSAITITTNGGGKVGPDASVTPSAGVPVVIPASGLTVTEQ